MNSQNKSYGALVLVAMISAMGVGCDDPVQVGAPAPVAPRPGPSGPAPAGPAVATDVVDGDAGAADAGTGVPEYDDDQFVELETDNRDPFRGFARVFKVRNTQPPQRRVLMPTTAIDEMRLIAIITGVSQPRAMLVDTGSVGHVVKRGDYIGRPEVIQAGGAEGMPVTLNWRVDRIRANELVLTREDPTAPDRPPLTRLIPLHEEEDDLASAYRRTAEANRAAGNVARIRPDSTGGGAIPPPVP